MFYRQPTQTEELKKKLHEEAKRTVLFLAKASTILKSKRFLSYAKSKESRFEWASDRLHKKLIDDLVFQLDQAIPLRHHEAKSLPLGEKFEAVASVIDKEVDRITAMHDIQLTKKEMGFSVSKDQSFDDELYSFFSRDSNGSFVKDINRSFYAWNSLNAVAVFVRAKRTLTYTTGHNRFEKFLASLSEDYMLAGYPHDILAHDAEAIRGKQELKGILVRREYCSTGLITATCNEPTSSETWKFVKFKAA
jgi:hypothetical protein